MRVTGNHAEQLAEIFHQTTPDLGQDAQPEADNIDIPQDQLLRRKSTTNAQAAQNTDRRLEILQSEK